MKIHPQLERIKIKGEKVYIDGKIQKAIDGASCEIIFPNEKTEDAKWFDAIYLKDKKAVYFVQLQIYRSQTKPKVAVRQVTTDISHFLIFESGLITKDSSHVYLWGKILDGVDAATFEVIPSHYFFRDKNHVYYCANYEPNFMTLLYADPRTFVAFQDKHGNYHEFASDKDNLYCNWRLANESKWGIKNLVYSKGKMLRTAFVDYEERVTDFIGKNKNLKGYWWSSDYNKKPQDARPLGVFHYAKSPTAVFTKNQKYDTPELINGADPNTFEPSTEEFSRDNKAVYYWGYQLPEVDPKSLKVISNEYVADSEHVYYLTTRYDEFFSFKITSADPDTFKVIDDFWAEDKNHVYNKGVIHEGSVPGNKVKVAKLNDRFSKDNNYVYWDGQVIKKSDPATFELLFEDDPQSWSKDSINLYNANGHRIVKGIDGKTFTMLDAVYGKDKRVVFCFENGRILTSADTKTFVIITESGLAKDKNSFFFLGKKITEKKYEEFLSRLTPLLNNDKKLKKKRADLWFDL